jgi:hypothetical protein
VAVADAPLNNLAVADPHATEGSGFSGFTVATFFDNNTTAPATDFTATISWGDGISSSASVVVFGSGIFLVVGSHTYAEETSSPISLNVQVADDGGASFSHPINIRVADAPLSSLTINNPNATEGIGLSGFTVATFTDANSGATAADFKAAVKWGDGTTFTLPSSAIVATGGGTFAVRASHTYADEGSYLLAVQILDDGGASIAGGQTIAVADGALGSLSIHSPGPTEGKSTGLVTVATFSDANLKASSQDFTATIQWGDGGTTTVSASGIAALGGGNFVIKAAHTYADEGTYTVSVQVVDDGGAPIAASQTLAVADATLTNLTVSAIPATEGKATGNVRVASFYDNNVRAPVTDFTATITWGDGSTTTVSGAAGNIVAVGNGWFYLLASHTYAEEGSYTLSVQVLDDGGSSASASRVVGVADAVLNNLGVHNPHATAGKDTGTFTVATFHDNNLLAPTSDFTAVVNWGDNTTTTLSASDFVPEGNGNFAVLASHLYSTSGSFTLSVTVDDVGGSGVSGALTITVA